jgi:non-specific protein-tyrosine kinase
LLSSAAMQKLLARLRADYASVLIDGPAVLPVADAAALAPSTDGVLLACRYHRTTASELRAAVEALRAVSANLIGTVFTFVPRKGPRAYGRDSTSAEPAGDRGPEIAPASSRYSSARPFGRHSAVNGDNRGGT